MSTENRIILALAVAAALAGCVKKNDDASLDEAIPPDYQPERNVIAMVYGHKHVFTVMTPDGWVLDKRAAKDNKLGSFFYPDSSPIPVITYMYAQGWDKDSSNPDMETFIKGDIETCRQGNPGLKAKQVETIATHDSREAVVYEFENIGKSAGERVAYIDVPHTVCVLVFSSNSKEEYRVNIDKYRTFVKSYHYLTDDPVKAKEIYKKFVGSSTKGIR